MRYGNLKIIVPPPIEVTVKRTWKDRLFSLPWHPRQSTKIELHENPVLQDGQVIKIVDCLYMNTFTYDQFKRGLNENK